jgi:hypothetical protein
MAGKVIKVPPSGCGTRTAPRGFGLGTPGWTGLTWTLRASRLFGVRQRRGKRTLSGPRVTGED